MAPGQEVVQNVNLLEYFRDMVQRAVANQRIDLTEDSEFYVVNLLTEVRKTERLFDMDSGKPEETPLALLLERAVHSDTATRVHTLKLLGDTALFVAGIFPERATRRFSSLDYYIRMGGGAYLTLATALPGQCGFAELFEEMGIKFKNLVGIVHEVGISGRENNDVNLLDYYERFLATGDARLRDILIKEGIIPVGKIIEGQ